MLAAHIATRTHQQPMVIFRVARFCVLFSRLSSGYCDSKTENSTTPPTSEDK